MPISPENARIRAQKGGFGRNSPDTYIRSLAAAELTAEQKRKLAKLVASFFDGDEQPGGAGTGDAA